MRFGKDFELDLRGRCLRRAHRLIKLERIPFDILVLLVEREGELVTRNQIAERIWGNETFLDTDNSINGAIRKIRLVLNDHADQPKFIQTVTGNGYRFIAPVAFARSDTTLDPNESTSEGAPLAPFVDAGTSKRKRRWLAYAAVVTAGAFAIASGWLAGLRMYSSAPAGGRMMLAVLPFENLTGDSTQEYFSDGVTGELIARLGRLDPDRLGIIARTSVIRYKSARVDLRAMERELGVDYIIEGSIRRDTTRVRIAVQLIRVKDQAQIWAEQYDHDQTDLLAVQAQLARSVADATQLTLGHARFAAGTPLSPTDYEAYDAYLRGRYFLNKRTPDGIKQAVASFEEAVLKNPLSATAHAGLADCYALMSSYGFAPAGELIPKARTAALKAMQIDDRLAEAHTALALIFENQDWEWNKAEKEFRRAVELDPNYATAHHWYAEYLAFQGRFEEALGEIDHARRLDPLSLIVATDLGAILYFSRQYDRAIRQFSNVLAMDPTIGRAHMIVFAFSQKGQFADALADIERWQQIEAGPWTWALAAYVHGRAGRYSEAQHALEMLKESNQQFKLEPPLLFATAHIGMGQHHEALTWLQRGVSKRSNSLIALNVDPTFDPLRRDAQFQQLLRQVGFTP